MAQRRRSAQGQIQVDIEHASTVGAEERLHQAYNLVLRTAERIASTKTLNADPAAGVPPEPQNGS